MRWTARANRAGAGAASVVLSGLLVVSATSIGCDDDIPLLRGPVPYNHRDLSYAADPATGRVFVYGGVTDEGAFRGLWSYQDGRYERLDAGSEGIFFFIGAALAFDPIQGLVYRFGGFDPGPPRLVTRGLAVFDLSSNEGWRFLFSGDVPLRTRASLLFDADTGRLLLYGGEDENGEPVEPDIVRVHDPELGFVPLGEP